MRTVVILYIKNLFRVTYLTGAKVETSAEFFNHAIMGKAISAWLVDGVITQNQ